MSDEEESTEAEALEEYDPAERPTCWYCGSTECTQMGGKLWCTKSQVRDGD